MRVVVAGAQTDRVSDLLRALRAMLPLPFSCEAWSDGLAMGPRDVLLLVGLNVSNAALQAQERVIREKLLQAGFAFQVIHDDDAWLLKQARHALARSLLPHHPDLAETFMRDEIAPRWQGLCESCSDPDCEHRLFRRLLTP
jgi:hypothetical protein